MYRIQITVEQRNILVAALREYGTVCPNFKDDIIFKLVSNLRALNKDTINNFNPL